LVKGLIRFQGFPGIPGFQDYRNFFGKRLGYFQGKKFMGKKGKNMASSRRSRELYIDQRLYPP